MVQQGRQFALEEVEVVTATVDLQSVVSARCAFMSMQGMVRIECFWPLDPTTENSREAPRSRIAAAVCVLLRA